jgi:hypothetical protein
MMETLESRKAYLITLRQMIEAISGKYTRTEQLSLNALNAEIKYIEGKMQRS